MPVLVVGTEKNFAALRPRLFEGRVSTKAAGEVKDAIRAANPGVDLDKLQPGTVLVVPAAPSVRVRGELDLDETTRDALEGLASVGANVLRAVADTAAEREAGDAAERKQLAKALDPKRLEPLTRADKELGAELETVRKTLAEEDGRAREREAGLKRAREEWTAGLEALRGLLD